MADRDRPDEKNHAAKMEALVQTYERKNQELEEKELEVRYRLQMLENTMPALMMWNIWRMMMSVQSEGAGVVMAAPHASVQLQGKGHKDGFSIDFDPNAPQQLPFNREEELMVKLRGLENKLNTQSRLLEEARTSEDELKGKLRDLEKLMAKEQFLGDILDNEVDQDVELFEKLRKMAKERLEMDKRIKDLELKEKLYKETIEHADNFIAQLENKYDTQLKKKDLETFRSQDEKHRPGDKDSISSGLLEEKVVALDNELRRLRDELTMKDKEKIMLEGDERKLLHELQETMNELENMRGEIEGPLKAKIEQSKQRSRAIEEELKASENYRLKMDTGHVDTNEINYNDDLKFLLSWEKDKKEYVKKSLPKENPREKKKPVDIESIFKSNCETTSKSLHDQIPEQLLFSQEMLDQEIISTKGEFRFTTTKEMNDESNQENEDSVLLSQIISEQDLAESQNAENLMSVFSRWKNLMPMGLTDITATQFQAFIAMVEQDEPQDVELSNISLHRDFPLSKPGLPEDCNVAQNAVTNLSGKDVKGTVDNLSKAYHHSKRCVHCTNLILKNFEKFVADVKELKEYVKKGDLMSRSTN